MIDFKTLHVWELGHKVTLLIYKVTTKYPREEIYGLVSQMRSSSSSIPTNIAEGCGRGSDKDLVRFLHMAMGSSSELEYQLYLSKDLNYITTNEYSEYYDLLIQLRKMLNAFIKKIKQRDAKPISQNLKSEPKSDNKSNKEDDNDGKLETRNRQK